MNEQEPLKKCSRCGTEKPLTPEFYQRDRSMRDGYKAGCKVCRNSQKQPPRQVAAPIVTARSPEQEALSTAKQYALKKLVENHPREFQQNVNHELVRLGFPKRWTTAT